MRPRQPSKKSAAKISKLQDLPRILYRWDWIYLLSLLIPFAVYTLALRAYEIASHPGDFGGLAQALDLMWSNVFFNLGYALFWIGLFAVTRKGPLRLVVVLLFHATTMLVVVTTTVAHHYFLENGTTLDYGTIAEWLPKFQEVVPILFQGRVPILAWMLFAVALLYATLGPLFVSRAAGRWRGWPEGRFSTVPTETTILGALGPLLLALGFGSFSLLTGTTTLARAPFVNVVLTGIKQVNVEEDISDAAQPTEHPAAHASLAATSRTDKRNVVLIHLESTRAQSVTPYNEDLKTTPFLDELAKTSILVERAYVVVPRSSKATVTVNCGIDPPLYQGPEYNPGGIPVPCLGNLLKDQGYDTVFFQSSSEKMDQYGVVAENLGYEILGYQVENGEYPGYSLLRPLPEDRTLRFSCISSLKCLARIKGNEKYIYHYDNQPEEVFNLSEDPLEEHNLADQYSEADLDKWRKDLFAWLSSVNSKYSAKSSS